MCGRMQFEPHGVASNVSFNSASDKDALALNHKAHQVNAKAFYREHLFIFLDVYFEFNG